MSIGAAKVSTDVIFIAFYSCSVVCMEEEDTESCCCPHPSPLSRGRGNDSATQSVYYGFPDPESKVFGRMRNSQSGERGTGKRTAYALAECALIMVMRSDRRMRPMPSFPTVCTSPYHSRESGNPALYAPVSCVRVRRGTSPRATVRRERLPAPPIRAVSSLPNCCACYAHTGWSADQRLKFSVEEAASFGRASSHIWVHVVESRSSDSGLARLRAANPGKTGRPVG